MSILAGALVGDNFSGIIFALPLIAIRKYSGGYHAKKAAVCFISSGVLLIGALYVVKYTNWNAWYIGWMIVAMISLVIHSPIDCENRRLTDREKIKYKKITGQMVFVFFIAAILFEMKSCLSCAKALAGGMIFTSMLQVPCIIKKIRDH